MNKTEVVRIVTSMIAAPSCCQELKSAGRNYLNAVGTDAEKTAAAALLQQLESDVQTLDQTIPLLESELGAKLFGAERARTMAEQARTARADGAKWCTCPACSEGSKLLENADALR